MNWEEVMKQIKELVEENERLKWEHGHYKKDCYDLANENAKLVDENKQLKNNIKDIEADLKHYIKEHIELVKENEQLKDENKCLELLRDRAGVALDKRRLENKGLVEEIKQLRKDKRFIEDWYKDKNEQLRQEIDRLDLENESLKDDIENLKYEVKTGQEILYEGGWPVRKKTTQNNTPFMTYSIDKNPILNNNILDIKIHTYMLGKEAQIKYMFDKEIYEELKKLFDSNKIISIDLSFKDADILKDTKGIVSSVELESDGPGITYIKTNIELAK